MRKAYIILFLGIWVTALPYLGFPFSLKETLETISGLGVILFSFVLYREYQKRGIGAQTNFDNFSENKFEDKE